VVVQFHLHAKCSIHLKITQSKTLYMFLLLLLLLLLLTTKGWVWYGRRDIQKTLCPNLSKARLQPRRALSLEASTWRILWQNPTRTCFDDCVIIRITPFPYFFNFTLLEKKKESKKQTCYNMYGFFFIFMRSSCAYTYIIHLSQLQSGGVGCFLFVHSATSI
jgi:hypothetical protein